MTWIRYTRHSLGRNKTVTTYSRARTQLLSPQCCQGSLCTWHWVSCLMDEWLGIGGKALLVLIGPGGKPQLWRRVWVTSKQHVWHTFLYLCTSLVSVLCTCTFPKARPASIVTWEHQSPEILIYSKCEGLYDICALRYTYCWVDRHPSG